MTRSSIISAEALDTIAYSNVLTRSATISTRCNGMARRALRSCSANISIAVLTPTRAEF